MRGSSASVMVLFLIVRGSIPIVYQNKSRDASKKCKKMGRVYVIKFGHEVGQLWVEMKNCGLKMC
jgi:hypothetical protein